jgi:hypothetical protein
MGQGAVCRQATPFSGGVCPHHSKEVVCMPLKFSFENVYPSRILERYDQADSSTVCGVGPHFATGAFNPLKKITAAPEPCAPHPIYGLSCARLSLNLNAMAL